MWIDRKETSFEGSKVVEDGIVDKVEEDIVRETLGKWFFEVVISTNYGENCKALSSDIIGNWFFPVDNNWGEEKNGMSV